MEPLSSRLALNAQIIGQGPPLIILHGLFGSQRNWGLIARALADQAQIHGLDLRNHGQSPWDKAMDYDLMAGDVARYIDENRLARVGILGHSMGGKVAMRLALTRPELVASLIIVDIAPVPYHNDHYSDYIAAMLALPLDQFTRRSEVDLALQKVIPDDNLRAFLLQNLQSVEGRFVWRINLADIGRAMPAILDFPASNSMFPDKSWFLAGEKSNYIRPRDRDAIARLFPAATLLEIADSGHWPHAEHPERFIAMLRPILAG